EIPGHQLGEVDGAGSVLEGTRIAGALQRELDPVVHRHPLHLPGGPGRADLDLGVEALELEGAAQHHRGGRGAADVAGAHGEESERLHPPIVSTSRRWERGTADRRTL